MPNDPLLQPYRLKHLTLRNLLMTSAHEPAYSEGGMPKDRYRLYHLERAKGGVALTMTAGSGEVDPASYVTGHFSGTATFGAGEANETELTAAGLRDIFVAKYAPNGTLLWARSAGGTDFDSGFGIARDRRGNSYVTGSFAGTATFGAGEANETELTASGEPGEGDILVAKYRDVRGRRSR